MSTREQPAVAGPVELTAMQHSPGPWRFDKQMGKPRMIIDAHNHSLMGDEEYYPWVPEDEADWHLIAAAPDLLASLRDVLAYFDAPGNGCLSDEALARARAAVARAVGAA